MHIRGIRKYSEGTHLYADSDTLRKCIFLSSFVWPYFSTDEAHWSSGPTVTVAAVNDTSKEIVCSVCANPQPTYLWIFRNKNLRTGIHVEGNKIVLDRVTSDDFGTYQCIASNIVNGATTTTTHYILLKEIGELLTVCLLITLNFKATIMFGMLVVLR